MILVRHGQSEFNVVFSETRRDPGIVDPRITDLGRSQAAAAAAAIDRASMPVERIVSSPYTRALETAAILAETLDAPVQVDPLVGERGVFVCDIGTPATELRRLWPALDLDHLGEEWWPREEEEAALGARGTTFLEKTAAHPQRDRTVVVTHWGFIRALTGLTVANGAVVRLGSDGRAALVHPPDP